MVDWDPSVCGIYLWVYWALDLFDSILTWVVEPVDREWILPFSGMCGMMGELVIKEAVGLFCLIYMSGFSFSIGLFDWFMGGHSISSRFLNDGSPGYFVSVRFRFVIEKLIRISCPIYGWLKSILQKTLLFCCQFSGWFFVRIYTRWFCSVASLVEFHFTYASPVI